MKNIYIDTTKIHDNTGDGSLFVRPEIQGLEMPEIRLSSYLRPNADGAIVPGHLYGGRLVSFRGHVQGDTITDYRTLRRTVESALSIRRDTDGTMLTRTLKFTTMDDLALQVDVQTKRFVFPDKDLLHGDYNVDLFAPDFALLSQTQKTHVIAAFTGGGMAIPMGIPMDMSSGGSTEATLVNSGNISAYPQITITGPVLNPTIINDMTGETLDLTYELTDAAESVVIDTLRRTVIYYATSGGSPVNIRGAMTGDFISLMPGNNVVKLVLASTSDGVATFAWRDSYAGV